MKGTKESMVCHVNSSCSSVPFPRSLYSLCFHPFLTFKPRRDLFRLLCSIGAARSRECNVGTKACFPAWEHAHMRGHLHRFAHRGWIIYSSRRVSCRLILYNLSLTLYTKFPSLINISPGFNLFPRLYNIFSPFYLQLIKQLSYRTTAVVSS